MSGLPAWKRALLEKKKQQEQEEEIKKQQEQEAYLKSLPAWKRAIVIRDMEKGKGSPSSARKTTGNAPTTSRGSQLASAKDKWKTAQSKISSPSTAEKSESPAKSVSAVAKGGPGGAVRALVANQSKESGKPSWVKEKSPTSPSRESSPVAASNSTENQPSPRTVIREQCKGSVQLLAGQFKPDSPPPSSASSRQENEPKESVAAPERKRDVTPPQKQEKKEPSPHPASTTTVKAQVPTAQVDDSDLAGLPSWKRALILKKRQKLAGLVPEANTQPLNETTDKPSLSVSTSQVNGLVPPKSPTPTSDAMTSSKNKSSRPDVVNRANESDNPGSNKLVQKEGVTLHPPIFNEVGQWANVGEDDPKFTQLPQWKQALILRRRKDIAKRSGQETSPPESPTVKTGSEKRKSSTSSSSAETKKGSKKTTTSKSAGKTEARKKTTKTKASEEKKTTTVKTSSKSKAKKDEEKSVKTAVKASNKASKTGSTTERHQGKSSGEIKPVRSAPTKPPEKKQEEDDKKEEEPMFTWNFSKNSMDTGDAMSNSSDSELEDVQITSIDDELSDEDDSGIGGSGGTILKSYKPLSDSSDTEERREMSVTPERSMSNSTSDTVINNNNVTRSESKSILIDPAKKSYKVSEVSPSESLLVTIS